MIDDDERLTPAEVAAMLLAAYLDPVERAEQAAQQRAEQVQSASVARRGRTLQPLHAVDKPLQRRRQGAARESSPRSARTGHDGAPPLRARGQLGPGPSPGVLRHPCDVSHVGEMPVVEVVERAIRAGTQRSISQLALLNSTTTGSIPRRRQLPSSQPVIWKAPSPTRIMRSPSGGELGADSGRNAIAHPGIVAWGHDVRVRDVHGCEQAVAHVGGDRHRRRAGRTDR